MSMSCVLSTALCRLMTVIKNDNISFSTTVTNITIPSFSGSSYLQLPLSMNLSSDFSISLSVRTTSRNVLLLFSSSSSSYFSLTLNYDGIAIFRYSNDIGDDITALGFPVNDNRWHRIHLSRQNSLFSLRVDGGIIYTSNFSGGFESLSTLYVGGVSMSLSLPSALGSVVGLDGCVSELVIDGADVELIENALDGVRVTECVLDMCTPETCLNNGVCVENSWSLGYSCRCSLGFTGTNCQQGEHMTYSCYKVVIQF